MSRTSDDCQFDFSGTLNFIGILGVHLHRLSLVLMIISPSSRLVSRSMNSNLFQFDSCPPFASVFWVSFLAITLQLRVGVRYASSAGSNCSWLGLTHWFKMPFRLRYGKIALMWKLHSILPYCGPNAVQRTQKPFPCSYFLVDWPHFKSMIVRHIGVE